MLLICNWHALSELRGNTLVGLISNVVSPVCHDVWCTCYLKVLYSPYAILVSLRDFACTSPLGNITILGNSVGVINFGINFGIHHYTYLGNVLPNKKAFSCLFFSPVILRGGGVYCSNIKKRMGFLTRTTTPRTSKSIRCGPAVLKIIVSKHLRWINTCQLLSKIDNSECVASCLN